MSGYCNDTVAGRTESRMGTKCPLMLLGIRKWDTQPWTCLFALKLLSQYGFKHLCVIELQSKADFVFGMSFSYCLLLSFILLCCMKQPWESNSIFFLDVCVCQILGDIYLSIKNSSLSLCHTSFPLWLSILYLYLWYFYALLSPLVAFIATVLLPSSPTHGGCPVISPQLFQDPPKLSFLSVSL